MKVLSGVDALSTTPVFEPAVSTGPGVSTPIDRSARLLIWSVAAILISLPVLIQERIDKEARDALRYQIKQ